jgi:hypothetical protein
MIAQILERRLRLHEALAACNRVLNTVPPDSLPETRNYALLRTFRLHKDVLDLKIKLFRRMRRGEEAQEAEALRERLYPPDAWRKATEEAFAARGDYYKKWIEEGRAEGEAEAKECRESEAEARRQERAEKLARQEQLDEAKARDEERQRRYEEWRRRRKAQDEAVRQPERGHAEPQ